MNLKEHIQSEIKSQLGESTLNEVCWDNYKQVGMKTKGGKQVPNCVPEGLKEGIMSDIHLTIKSSSTEDEFIKKFFKQYGKQVKPNKESIEWKKPNGVRVEFVIDGRIQLNGDGGLQTYIEGTILVNPHVKIKYKPYAYATNSSGTLTTFDGTRVDKVWNADQEALGLYDTFNQYRSSA